MSSRAWQDHLFVTIRMIYLVEATYRLTPVAHVLLPGLLSRVQPAATGKWRLTTPHTAWLGDRC
jgi:hypothetical protein